MSRLFELIDKITGEVTFAGVAVTRRKPCEICGHPTNKPVGWCLHDSKRGLTLCGHVPSKRVIGTEAGWLHGKETKSLERAVASVPKPRPKFDAMPAVVFKAAMSQSRLSSLSADLGVTNSSLMSLDTGWDAEHDAYAFPMRDDRRNIIGIRLRRPDGFKFAIENSRNGLFYPELVHDGPVLLPEGPTDTAAMMSLGFDAIGRPFCRGGIESLCEVFNRIQRPAVIIQDLDAVLDENGLCAHCSDVGWCARCRPGQFGAAATADALFGIASWVKVIAPPPGIKDARQWLKDGATLDSVMYRIYQEDLWHSGRMVAK